MSRAPELNRQYDITITALAQQRIHGYAADPWHEQTNDILRAILMSVALARSNAVSHRGFTVGAVGVGLRETMPNRDHIIRTFHGANDKPEPTDTVNIHAEHEVLDSAERCNSVLTVLALYGDNQPDDGKGTNFPAIMPCSKVCLPKLQCSPAIDRKRTVFASLSPHRETLLLYRLDELEHAYEIDSSSAIHQLHLGGSLQLFDISTPVTENRAVQQRNGVVDEAFKLGVVDFTHKHQRERGFSGNLSDWRRLHRSR